MALPKLNTPTHELVLPSTGEKVKYRPFLVKEQKILMLAQESEDDVNISNTIGDLITSCTFGKVDGHESPMFDVEFIFLRLRAKSVGETAEISILAQDDNKTRVPVKVNLEEIDVHMTANHTNEVTLNDTTKFGLNAFLYAFIFGLSKFSWNVQLIWPLIIIMVPGGFSFFKLPAELVIIKFFNPHSLKTLIGKRISFMEWPS